MNRASTQFNTTVGYNPQTAYNNYLAKFAQNRQGGNTSAGAGARTAGNTTRTGGVCADGQVDVGVPGTLNCLPSTASADEIATAKAKQQIEMDSTSYSSVWVWVIILIFFILIVVAIAWYLCSGRPNNCCKTCNKSPCCCAPAACKPKRRRGSSSSSSSSSSSGSGSEN